MLQGITDLNAQVVGNFFVSIDKNDPFGCYSRVIKRPIPLARETQPGIRVDAAAKFFCMF